MIKKTLNKSINQKNINFFSENKDYQKNISEIDTYKILYEEITNRLKGRKKLLDIGHGGCFDYDSRVVNEIIGLDLDKMISAEKIPENGKFQPENPFPKVSRSSCIFWESQGPLLIHLAFAFCLNKTNT